VPKVCVVHHNSEKVVTSYFTNHMTTKLNTGTIPHLHTWLVYRAFTTSTSTANNRNHSTYELQSGCCNECTWTASSVRYQNVNQYQWLIPWLNWPRFTRLELNEITYNWPRGESHAKDWVQHDQQHADHWCLQHHLCHFGQTDTPLHRLQRKHWTR